MTESRRLSDLFGRRRFAIKPGTERIEALLAQLGHPERKFVAIHIVGTNGKGSTAAFLAAILEQAGYKTGLFTSPHLVRYHERFRINGAEIPDQELHQLLDALLANTAAESATFFEVTTALACSWFAQMQVEVAVIEAGMGGLHDATAAIPGIATVVTPISLDHCQWLGNSETAIAHEKIGITKPGTPLISAAQSDEVTTVITAFCATNGSPLTLYNRDFFANRSVSSNLFNYTSPSLNITGLRSALPGCYQIDNAALAVAAGDQLRQGTLAIPLAAFSPGLAATHWPGRLEMIKLASGTKILLDGAHNPAGAHALATELQERNRQRIILLIGMMEDKESEAILQQLLCHAERVICVSPAQERAMSAAKLAALCRAAGAIAQPADTVAEGLSRAETAAAGTALIVATGSLFLVGEVKALLAGVSCDAVSG